MPWTPTPLRASFTSSSLKGLMIASTFFISWSPDVTIFGGPATGSPEYRGDVFEDTGPDRPGRRARVCALPAFGPGCANAMPRPEGQIHRIPEAFRRAPCRVSQHCPQLGQERPVRSSQYRTGSPPAGPALRAAFRVKRHTARPCMVNRQSLLSHGPRSETAARVPAVRPAVAVRSLEREPRVLQRVIG